MSRSTADYLRRRFLRPSQIVADAEPAGTAVGAVGGLLIVIALMFTPAIVFPHYLADDLWAFRPADDNFPSSLFISVAQGRPVFAFLLDLSRALHDRLGHWAVSLVRAQAVLFVFLFGWGLYRWALIFVGSRTVAFCVAIATVALPSVQMYVIGGPWLAWAWAFAAWVPFWIARHYSRERSLKSDLAIGVLILIGLILGLATYQSTPFLLFALLILPIILSKKDDRLADQAGLAAALLIFAVAVYFLIWLSLNRTMGIAGETRYSPSTVAMSFADHWELLPLRIELFIGSRLPMISALWDVRSSGLNFAKPILFVMAAGCFCDFLLRNSARGRLQVIVRWAIGVALFIVCDTPPLIAKPGVNIYSYMTAGPTAVALMMLLLAASIRIFQLADAAIGSARPLFRRLRSEALVAPIVAALFGALGLYTSTAYYVLPAWIDQALVRTQLREELARVGQITSVIAYSRIVRVLNSDARGEFSWSNMGADFYARWLVRRVLDDLGQNSDLKIEVRAADGKTYSNPRFSVPPTDKGIATVDFRGIVLDRSAAPEPRYFEILASAGPSGPRPGHSQSVISAWTSLPAGERYVPLHVVESSFDYSDQGAAGEAALTDGNLNVPAADSRGVTADTRATVQLSEPARVSRIRVLRDAVVRTETETTLKVEGTLDGRTWRNLGRLVLDPSASSITDLIITDMQPLSIVRLSYGGGRLAENIWISEIGVTTK